MKKPFMIFWAILLLAACTGIESQIMPGTGPYNEWLSTCTDYKDVQNWFIGVDYTYDTPRLKGRLAGVDRIGVYNPWQTFSRKKGICSDTAVFTKYSLNKINPDYKAEILYLDEPGRYDHYVCVFTVDNKLMVMDYGTPKMKGLFGPYDKLEDFITFYREAKGKKVEHYHYGWPASRRESW